MTTRILPPDEWPKLAETGCQLPQMQEAALTGSVLVVERDGLIVGTCVVMICAHAEGLWIHPDLRGRGSVARRLIRATVNAASALGVSGLCVSALSDPVLTWLDTRWAGDELPGRHFVLPVRGLDHG